MLYAEQNIAGINFSGQHKIILLLNRNGALNSIIGHPELAEGSIIALENN